jgi:hypothetical protein
VTERLERDESAPVGDCDGSGWKCTLCDGVAQYREGRRKDFVLMVEGWSQRSLGCDAQGIRVFFADRDPVRVIAEFGTTGKVALRSGWQLNHREHRAA